MKTTRKYLNIIALGGALTTGGTLFAVPVFSVANGGIVITSQNTVPAGTSAAPWTVNETMTSAGTLALTDTDNFPLGPANTVGTHLSGSWITKTVTNNTGVAWTSFELELQQIIGTPSGEGDGLSFAQGSGLVFTSSVFSTVTRIDDTRDYLNFSGGSVPIGGSVSFSFAVTDNSPQSPLYLLQTPNKADVRVPDGGSTCLLFLVGLAGLMGLKRKFR